MLIKMHVPRGKYTETCLVFVGKIPWQAAQRQAEMFRKQQDSSDDGEQESESRVALFQDRSLIYLSGPHFDRIL